MGTKHIIISAITALFLTQGCAKDIDTQPPVISIDSPVEGSYINSSVEVRGSVSDQGSGIASVIVNGVTAAVSPGFFRAILTSLLPGPLTLKATAIDNVGLSATHSILVKVEITPPLISIPLPQNGSYLLNSTPSISIFYSDTESGLNLESLEISINGMDMTYLFNLSESSATCQIPARNSLPEEENTIRAVIKDLAGNCTAATSTFTVFTEGVGEYPWPFAPFDQPQTLGHLIHQYQYYGGDPPYFHHGIDIMVDAGTDVFSITSGYVVNIENYRPGIYYWEVAVEDLDGFLWQYHHIEENTIPQAIRDAYESGDLIDSGTKLGQVIAWPMKAYGMPFNHIHLNVLDPNMNYLNSLDFLIEPNDTTTPEILEVYFCPNGGKAALSQAGDPEIILSGDIDIIVKAEDLIEPAPYQLTIYETAYSVNELSGTGTHNIPETVLYTFDRIPGGGDWFQDIYTVFKESLVVNGTTLRTRGNYNNHDFYYIVTNTFQGELSEENGLWDTDGLDPSGSPLFPDGTYGASITVKDQRGNSSSRGVIVEVVNDLTFVINSGRN